MHGFGMTALRRAAVLAVCGTRTGGEEDGKPETGNRRFETGQCPTQPRFPVFRFLFPVFCFSFPYFVALFAVLSFGFPVPAALACAGDCDASGEVTVDELLIGVGMALGEASPESCAAFDNDLDGAVTVDEILAAVSNALNGCPAPETGCNGADALCDRRFDEVAYATTHNAMSNAEDGFQGPNQHFSIARQLADGVRALMLDTYLYEGDVYLCHADCSFLGRRPLLDGLAEIKDFLDRHPREVVSIIFESYAPAADTAAVFEAAGLTDYVHTQIRGEAWPTLGEMIESGRQLVVFTDNDAGDPPWYHYVWDFAFETPFSFERPEDFSCRKNRGSLENPLFILNHFLTRTFGRPELARMVNFDPLFIERAEQCMSEHGRLPNFVTVDFYDIGDVFGVVDALNGLGRNSQPESRDTLKPSMNADAHR
jgi:hypothetical protein